ncbi:hypothetical protein [Lysinibacillus boronitolerans]
MYEPDTSLVEGVMKCFSHLSIYLLKDVVQLSENLRLQLEQHSFPVVGHKPSSFGVICFVKDDTFIP